MAKTAYCKCGANAILKLNGRPKCWACFDTEIVASLKAVREAWEARGWDRFKVYLPPENKAKARLVAKEMAPAKQDKEQGDLF